MARQAQRTGTAPGSAAAGTVTGLLTTTHYALGSWSVFFAGVLLLGGLCGLGLTMLSRATLPYPALLATLLAGVATLVALSRVTVPRVTVPRVTVPRVTGPRATGAAGAGGAARRLWGAVGAGAWVAVRPLPVRTTAGGTDRWVTRAQRFEVVDVSGARAACEYLGPLRRRAPEVGALAEVYGFRLRDGTVRARRIVYPADGSTFTPRADLAFAVARLSVGLATAAGAALGLLSLVAMAFRHS